jgi:hypothetical protein
MNEKTQWIQRSDAATLSGLWSDARSHIHAPCPMCMEPASISNIEDAVNRVRPWNVVPQNWL